MGRAFRNTLSYKLNKLTYGKAKSELRPPAFLFFISPSTFAFPPPQSSERSQYENSQESTFSKSQQKQKSTAIKPIRSERSLQRTRGGQQN